MTAHVCAAPPLAIVTPLSAWRNGEGAGLVVPSPICPSALSPQQRRSSGARAAHVCPKPPPRRGGPGPTGAVVPASSPASLPASSPASSAASPLASRPASIAAPASPAGAGTTHTVGERVVSQRVPSRQSRSVRHCSRQRPSGVQMYGASQSLLSWHSVSATSRQPSMPVSSGWQRAPGGQSTSSSHAFVQRPNRQTRKSGHSLASVQFVSSGS